jgi:predicted metalloprotease
MVPAGRGGRVAVGGGVGGLLLVVVMLLLGQDPTSLLQPAAPAGSAVAAGAGSLSECETGADVEANPDCRFVAYVNSINDVWTQDFRAAGAEYRPAQTVVFTGGVQTGCGPASSDVGPFYCPNDRTIYLDLGFFRTLQERFGGSGGDFAEAYVLAHEYGHHVSNLTGQFGRVRTQQGPDSDAVRLELQADCFAGVWANAASAPPEDGSEPFLVDITEQDIREGLDAARIVGDDYIQERFTGTVSPESWTHGSSEQRQRWFLTGYESGSFDSCNTFTADPL